MVVGRTLAPVPAGAYLPTDPQLHFAAVLVIGATRHPVGYVGSFAHSALERVWIFAASPNQQVEPTPDYVSDFSHKVSGYCEPLVRRGSPAPLAASSALAHISRICARVSQTAADALSLPSFQLSPVAHRCACSCSVLAMRRQRLTSSLERTAAPLFRFVALDLLISFLCRRGRSPAAVAQFCVRLRLEFIHAPRAVAGFARHADEQ